MNEMNPKCESYQAPDPRNSMTLRQIINKFKKIFPNDKVEGEVNFHYCSGFITLQDGRVIYFSTSDERDFGNVSQDVLIRTAKSTKDYTGGSNNTIDLTRKNISREIIIGRLYGNNQNNTQMV